MTRVAVYIRMSTDDQAGSPERQKGQVLPYCERQGYQVVRTYEDLGLRGDDDSRPQFQAMLEDAQAGQFSLIIVDEMSRLSRANPYRFFKNVADPLREAGVAVEVVAEGGRRQTWDEDDLIDGLLSFVGQHKNRQEARTLGRRTATGLLKLAKKGQLFSGRAAYGTKYVLDEQGKRTGYAHGDPDHVRVVQFIFSAYVVRDLSHRAIVAELNAQGVPPPRGDRWTKNAVGRILRNPVYAGHYCFGKTPQGKFYRLGDSGEVVAKGRDIKTKSTMAPRSEWTIIRDRHAPLVDPELFEQAQARLAKNRTRSSPSRIKGTHPLSGLLRCAHCDAPMNAQKAKGVQKYRCSSNLNVGTCRPRMAKESSVLTSVLEALRDVFLAPENLAALRAELQGQLCNHDDEEKENRERLRRRVAKLSADIEKARKNLAHLDAEYLRDVQDQIWAWRQEHAAALAELERATQPPANSVEHLIAGVEQLVERAPQADPSLLRVLLRETIDHVDLRFREERKKVYTRYPLDGGLIHLRTSADLAPLGPAADR
jgi:DNA invertase Pin-like site-specific DNA recombinase